MKRTVFGMAGVALLGAACSAANVIDDEGVLRGAPAEEPSADGGAGGGEPEDDGMGVFDPSSGSGGGTGFCAAGPKQDLDKDGFSIDDGDCNDCDRNVNPGAIEVPTDPMDPDAIEADENCNNAKDEPPIECDDGLDLADFDPWSAARALDLCDKVEKNKPGHGVTGALYVRADGTPAMQSAQVGLLDGFGPNVAPRKGKRMLGLSSGHARLPGQPQECGQISCSDAGPGLAPPGFPQDSANCSGDTEINDDVGLELTLRAPTNAKGFKYEFSFYSHEFPEWVCTSFNDQYIALVTPPPMGSINGNISFDKQNNPVSVNVAFFDVCEGCALGTKEMEGTGFDTWGWGGLGDAGATGWLVTTAPVEPGSEIDVRFAIWDTGDTAYDSTVILDSFEWIASAGTVEVVTTPVPK